MDTPQLNSYAEAESLSEDLPPIKRAVTVDNEECKQSVQDVAELVRNLDKDPYSEDETEMRFLYSKPSCFLLLGKPGVGKTSLARRFAAEWKCELINSTDIILQNMELQTEIGQKCVEILHRGEAIPDDMVLKMIEDKVNSPEVAHHGYVMDDFPCISEDLMSIKDQLELIKSWKLKPDFIINLRIPDKDIENRRIGQKIDPTTLDIYIKEVYAPDLPEPAKIKPSQQKLKPKKKKKVTPENEDSEEEEEEEEEEAELNQQELPPLDEEPVIELPLEVLERLIKRPEDMAEQVEENLGKYKTNMLRILEDYMADHDQQYLIEMDGNQTVLSLFKQLMQKLTTFVLRPAAVVTRLNDPEEEEMPEDMDTEELLRSFGPRQMVAPRYRWRRSRWLRNCPVALHEGNILPGKPEFTVSFLDKIYCLSSAEAMEKFVKNPRPYLLPDQPRPPCKLSIIGAPISGKTTLANLIAHKYGCKVFEINEVTAERQAADKKDLMEKTREETTQLAIVQVTQKLKEMREAEIAAKEEERLARLAAQAVKEQEEKERLEALKAVRDLAAQDEDFSSSEQEESGEADEEEGTTAEEEGVTPEEEKDRNSNEINDESSQSQEKIVEESTSEEKEPSSASSEPSEVDENHPDVIAIVNAAVREAEATVINLSAEVQVEVLDLAIKEWEKEIRMKKPEGALHGSWILDNFPNTREQWNACVEKNLLPDDVIVLGEESSESRSAYIEVLIRRYSQENRELLLRKISERDIQRRKNEEQERIRQEQERIREEQAKIQAEIDAENQRLAEEAAAEEARIAALEESQAEMDARKAELLADQILWDPLAGELTTSKKFNYYGYNQPMGPSFIDLIPEDQQTYARLNRKLDKISKRDGETPEPVGKIDMDVIISDTSTETNKTPSVKTPILPRRLTEDLKIEVKPAVDENTGTMSDYAEEDKTTISSADSELELFMQQPEVLNFIEKLKEADKDINNLIATITGTSAIEPFTVSIVGNPTPEIIFEKVAKHLERLFKYIGWELGAVDLDEEEEDLEAETLEAGEEAAGEEEAVEEEEEDPNRSIKRKFLGDSNYFDPVALKEQDILNPGNPEVAAVFREKVYYFSTNESRDKFLEDPGSFLSKDAPLKPPPIRLLILGAKGSGKTLHGRFLAEKLGCFHISFRERLQELIIAKTKKKIGPEYEQEEDETVETESDTSSSGDADKISSSIWDEENEEKTMSSKKSSVSPSTIISESKMKPSKEEVEKEMLDMIKDIQGEDDDAVAGKVTQQETEEGKTEQPTSSGDLKQPEATIPEEEEEEPELTEDEEAIKANLESADPLPSELLDSIISQWWNKEPFKSTGFILEGFPRTSEEVKYLQEAGLFPDAAIILQASDEDVIGRLLPPRLDKWKAKRDRKRAKKAKKKELAKEKRDAVIAKRRIELEQERDERKAQRQAEKAERERERAEESENEEEANDDEEEEDEEDDIDALLAEEFEEEEEEEDDDEEMEEDAIERMRNDFNEVYDDDTNRMSSVEETLEEVLIPRLDITAGRKPHIVRYILNKKLKPYVDHRHSIFERVYPLNDRQSKRILQVGYKQPSRFGRWDPVKMKEGDCIQPMCGPGFQSFPCFYRSHVYFLSSKQNRETFMQNPMTYLIQDSPMPVVPIKIAIVGPPKSGKTSLAKRFVDDYGVVRLSIGEAMRQVIQQQPKTELARQMNWHLMRGRVVPDDLQVQALEIAMLDMKVQTRGYVLDAYPINRRQIDLMTERSIIPVRVIELKLDSKNVMMRGVKDRLAPDRPYAGHDSAKILAIKLSCYLKTVGGVRDWYQQTHMNHREVNADQSKWFVWDCVNEIATSSVKRIQSYLSRTSEAKAACIADLCITPNEFDQRLGDFSQYCPVSLAEWGELVDCSVNSTLTFAAEFRGHYYKMAGQKELNMFLANPEQYVPPLAPKKLPPPALLPKRINADGLKDRKPEINGYCPVTYVHGKLRYEALVPGHDEFLAEYKEKVYLMQDADKLFSFMKTPEKYAYLTLPHKLPPRQEEMPLVNLPMLGFMEQTCAIAMVQALTSAGNVKPKYPFVSSTRSALIYIAYHLKAYNPKSSPYIRKKYKQKLQQFRETCELIKYLGNNMTVRYRDPNERPKDFDSKLETFFALRGVEPTPTWIT